MPRKSKAELELELERECKRVKTVVNTVADEFLCPITGELPVDPVTAEDGKIYDRVAIAKWLSKKKSSPITNLAMGARLLPATQVKNMIEQLVESGSVEGEKATAWEQKRQDERKLQELRTKAEGGDPMAIYDLAHAHNYGQYGMEDKTYESMRQARMWYQRGAELDHASCMARYGEFLLKGLGGAPKPGTGLIYCARAAEHGSGLAALVLGLAYAHGQYVLERDKSQAEFWLRKVIDNAGSNVLDKDFETSLSDAQSALAAISGDSSYLDDDSDDDSGGDSDDDS
eukprot:SAG31_NODE_2383_length_5825_cov_13.209745_3_plen_286_part_00